MVTLKKIFSLILLLGSVAVYSLDKNEVYDKLIAKYKNIKTFSADFIQVNYWKEIGDTLTSEGKIYYNSQKLLLDYIKPKQQKMLLDSTSLLIWDINDKQAVITKNNSDVSRPIDIIKNYWKNSKIVILNRKGDKISFRLISEQQTIDVVLKKFIIKKMKILNSEGNFVTYSFANIKTNVKLNDKIFNIKLPNDVKVMQNH